MASSSGNLSEWAEAAEANWAEDEIVERHEALMAVIQRFIGSGDLVPHIND